jgi:hypothetical protein
MSCFACDARPPGGHLHGPEPQVALVRAGVEPEPTAAATFAGAARERR